MKEQENFIKFHKYSIILINLIPIVHLFERYKKIKLEQKLKFTLYKQLNITDINHKKFVDEMHGYEEKKFKTKHEKYYRQVPLDTTISNYCIKYTIIVLKG